MDHDRCNPFQRTQRRRKSAYGRLFPDVSGAPKTDCTPMVLVFIEV